MRAILNGPEGEILENTDLPDGTAPTLVIGSDNQTIFELVGVQDGTAYYAERKEFGHVQQV